MDEFQCRERLNAAPEIITAFVPELGYDRCTELIKEFRAQDRLTVRELLERVLGTETVERTLAPQNLMALGYRN